LLAHNKRAKQPRIDQVLPVKLSHSHANHSAFSNWEPDAANSDSESEPSKEEEIPRFGFNCLAQSNLQEDRAASAKLQSARSLFCSSKKQDAAVQAGQPAKLQKQKQSLSHQFSEDVPNILQQFANIPSYKHHH
jgi:hypothetical protein